MRVPIRGSHGIATLTCGVDSLLHVQLTVVLRLHQTREKGAMIENYRGEPYF